jgi:hypothetical protein
MVFTSGKCRLELSCINEKSLKLEVSKGDQHQVHIIPIEDYVALLKMLTNFNKEVYCNVDIKKN